MKDRKRILITYDVEDWAYHKNAKVLQKYLSDEFEIHLISDQNKHALVHHMCQNPYDLLFLQWFPDVDIFYQLVKVPYPVVTQVTSSVFFKMHNEGWRGLDVVPLVVSKSKEYFEKLSGIIGESKSRLAYHVNDVENFVPMLGRRNSSFTVGYVGRNCEISDENKGHSIIREACDIAGVEFKMAGFDGRIPYEKMPDFYRSIDAVVCASRHEGAPNSMLEGGLCGTPLITTRVGQIQEMIEDGKNGFFCDRNPRDIAEKITNLKDNSELYNSFSSEIAKTSIEFANLAVSQWRNFFRESLNIRGDNQ